MTLVAKFDIDRGSFRLNCNLEIAGSGVTGLFGPSGAGKTTLLRAIAGLDIHSDGFVSFEGVSWQDGNRIVPTHRRPISYVFQSAALFPHLNIRSNIEYGRKRLGNGREEIDTGMIVEILQLERFLDRSPSTLSGGEKQRVAIARALAAGPRLLLMDEPLASLDNAGKAEIIPFLDELRHRFRFPIIYVTHNLDEVARLADRIVLLENGGVIANDDARNVLTSLDLPMARSAEAEAVLTATVDSVDHVSGISRLRVGDQILLMPLTSLPKDKKVRLRVAASDVSITLERQRNTSIQNILPVEITEISEPEGALVTIKLRFGETYLLSRITVKSKVELGLETGRKVFAQVKSVVLAE